MENLSLFSPEPEDPQLRLRDDGVLDVVEMAFTGARSLSWQELFAGFDTLHAITYSSSMGFVWELVEKFGQAEILFGCEEVRT